MKVPEQQQIATQKGGEKMTGAEVREMILAAGLRLWQVADRLGMSDNSFSRRLRFDFKESEVEQVKQIIDELKAK